MKKSEKLKTFCGWWMEFVCDMNMNLAGKLSTLKKTCHLWEWHSGGNIVAIAN